MWWLEELRRRLSVLRSRDRFQDDLKEEMEFHLELEADENRNQGMAAEEALHKARRQFGNFLLLRETSLNVWTWPTLESFYRDVVCGFRALRKSPVFFLTTAITLALGIGANTAIFTLLYSLLLRSLPVRNPSELVRIGYTFDLSSGGSLTWPMVRQLRRQLRSFTEISAWDTGSVTMKDRGGTVRMYDASMVSGNAFSLLGVQPYIGRLIAPSDDVRGGPAEGWPIVLGHGTWNDVFRGDPQIVGKRIVVSNTPVTVVGVTPPEFQGIVPGDRSKVYLPLQFSNVLEGRDVLNPPTAFYWLWPIARLKPGATLAQANAEVTTYRDALLQQCLPPRFAQNPEIKNAMLRTSSARTGVSSFRERTYRQPLLLMQGLVGVVLLLCCLNVGGLMMSKFYARRDEFAIRTTIGAGRWRLVRQYLTESCVVAGAGAFLGGVGAWYGTSALLNYFVSPDSQEGLFVRPDAAVLGISLAFGVVATLLFGTLPAWRAGRSDPGQLLNSRRIVGVRKQLAGRAFVPLQVALSLVLVAVAGLLSQSLIRIRSEHAGFDIDHVTLTCPQFEQLPLKPAAMQDLYQAMVDRLERSPAIQAATFTWYTPMTNSKATGPFRAASGGPHPPEDPKLAYNYVAAGYFRTMQTPILAGREFERKDRDLSVCVLNQSAAAFLFPRQQPIGQYVLGTDRQQLPEAVSCRVVGIAEDAKYASLREPAPRTIYFPMTEWRVTHGNMVFLMRSVTEAQAIAAYREALAEKAPNTPLLRFMTLHRQLDESMGAQRLLTLLSNVFAGVALFLSAIGLYGLLASSVAQRTGEIGVRVALGAQRGDVLRMILREAMRMFGVGLVLGALGLWGAVRFVKDMLFGVSAFDPMTLTWTAALLGIVAFAAAFIPARRAASVDPMQALRAE